MTDRPKGTVYRKEGKYLRYSEALTHTGSRYRAEWVNDLQHATILYGPLPYSVRMSSLLGADQFVAMEQREITLLCYKRINKPRIYYSNGLWNVSLKPEPYYLYTKLWDAAHVAVGKANNAQLEKDARSMFK